MSVTFLTDDDQLRLSEILKQGIAFNPKMHYENFSLVPLGRLGKPDNGDTDVVVTILGLLALGLTNNYDQALVLLEDKSVLAKALELTTEQLERLQMYAMVTIESFEGLDDFIKECIEGKVRI